MDAILKQGNGKEIKNKLMTKFPNLTEADFQYEEGVGQDISRLVENKLRKTWNELHDIIEKM